MVFAPSALGQPAPVRTIQLDQPHVGAIAISPKSDTLAIAMRDSLQLFEMSTGKAAKTIRADGHFLSCITFTTAGEGIVGVNLGKTARLWPLTPKLLERSFRVPNFSTQIAACSPTSSLLAIDGRETTIQIFDYTSGKRKFLLEGHIGGIFAVAFAPNGESLVSGGGDGKVIIWPLKNKGVPRRVAAHGPVGDWVFDVRYSPDGKTIASCSGDRVKFWNSATGGHVSTIDKLPMTVSRVRYSPDGNSLIAACGDGYIAICNVMNGAQELRFKAHDHVSGLELSLDGKWLVSSNFQEVKIWRVSELSSNPD